MSEPVLHRKSYPSERDVQDLFHLEPGAVERLPLEPAQRAAVQQAIKARDYPHAETILVDEINDDMPGVCAVSAQLQLPSFGFKRPSHVNGARLPSWLNAAHLWTA